MLIGYARISPQEQNLDPQKIELEKEVGCEKICNSEEKRLERFSELKLTWF